MPAMRRSPAAPSSSLAALLFFLMIRRPPRPTPFPYTTLFRSHEIQRAGHQREAANDQRARLDVLHHAPRSEEHTSELQSHSHLVCRLLLDYKEQDPITVYNLELRLPVAEKPGALDGLVGTPAPLFFLKDSAPPEIFPFPPHPPLPI